MKGSAFAAGLDNGAPPAPWSGAVTDKFKLLGSARARLGYLVRPDLLLFGTGGLAWTEFEQTMVSTNSAGTFAATTPTWRAGWVAGAGGQMRLWDSNWIARLEYLHYDFGKSGGTYQAFLDPTNVATGITLTKVDIAGRLTADIVRAGVDYKFD